MNHPKRIELVKIEGLATSYFGKILKKRLDVSKLGSSAFVCPDFREALLTLDSAVRLAGGNLFVTDLLRDWKTQAKARQDYMDGKKPFVAQPGASFHGAGRAVDLDIQGLNFPGAKQDWLKKLWELAIPLGFRPVIESPDMSKSEAWHLDFPGIWSPAMDYLSYDQVAIAANLDAGQWNPDEDITKIKKMFIQAQLIRRRHYEIGKIDGQIGKKTMSVLHSLDFQDFTDLNSMVEKLKK
ncbi:MAG: M15 family metallopeptidase [Candidatus Parcubacteria bacterium]|nr:M15 family metallopeptidase [Candidatus Parcubacteria bacterium]